MADFRWVALMGFPLSLERFMEFAPGVREAAYEPNAVLLPDGVIAVVAIDLKTAAIPFE
jgi:hypothetical protein